MSELAQLLKKRREEKGFTLSQISKDTKIREPFLADIEEGDYKALPSYLHCYGFVKKYAEYLGFSYDEIKDLFSSECPKPGTPTEEESAGEINEEPRKSGLGPWIAAVVVVLICAALWLGYQKKTGSREAAVSNAAEYSAAPVELYRNPEPSSEMAPPPVSATGTADIAADNLSAYAGGVPADNASPVSEAVAAAPEAETAPKTASGTVGASAGEAPLEERSVVFSFSERCWIKFVSDNGKVEDFLADPGTSKTLPFYNSFTVDIGNAVAVTMTYGTQKFSNFGGPNVPLPRLGYAVENGVLVRAAR